MRKLTIAALLVFIAYCLVGIFESASNVGKNIQSELCGGAK